MSPSEPAADGPLILAFDTSAAQCAAALVSGDRILARKVEPMERGQAERLLPLLAETLAAGGRDWRDLDALAVCVGPGNFTGLRIAVAAARGLAFGLGVPAVGVTRLEALAQGRSGRTLVALDARRGAAYAQSFQDGAPCEPPALIDVAALPAEDGALRLGIAAAPDTAEAEERADPVALARVAAGRLDAPVPPPAPLYLRPADAAPPSEAPPRLLDDA